MSKVGQVIQRLFNIPGIKYDVQMYVVRENPYRLRFDCNAMIFVNQGTTTAMVDQLSIPPDASFSIPGELFEEMEHQFNISFTGPGDNNLVCIMKFYK
jgi:hypothetical protein